MNTRRILIVEDDLFVAGLLQDSLQRHGFVAVVAHNALDAKNRLMLDEIDVALVDVELGDGPSGKELMLFIVRTHPETAVIMMTQRSALADNLGLPEHVAFLLKSKITDPQQLIAAIESTVRGQRTRHENDPTILDQLTRAQDDVLRMIALGYSNARIAQERNITQSGAEQAVSNVLRILGIEYSADTVPRVEAARRYIAAKGLPQPRA